MPHLEPLGAPVEDHVIAPHLGHAARRSRPPGSIQPLELVCGEADIQRLEILVELIE